MVVAPMPLWIRPVKLPVSGRVRISWPTPRSVVKSSTCILPVDHLPARPMEVSRLRTASPLSRGSRL